MSHIFISYSRKDLTVAEKIVSALATNNFNTWIDWKSIPKGEQFIHEIYRGIESADVFLFLISPDSVESDWCQKEIKHASENNKRIIPVVIRDTKNDSIPSEMANRNWIFCRNGQDDFDLAITEVIVTITADYTWVKYHTRLQVKALAWESTKGDTSRLLQGKELLEAEQQLTAASTKDPTSTNLQQRYVGASRKRLTLNRISLVVFAAALIGILSVLSIYAINQRASALKDGHSALARQLIANAEALDSVQSFKPRDQREPDLIVANLLAIQSLKLFPNDDAATFLLNGTTRSTFLDDSYLKFAPVTVFTNNVNNNDASFSPDGRYVVTGDIDNNAFVWESSSGNIVAQLPHDDIVSSVAFSPDGNYLVTGSRDGILRLWDTITWQEITRMKHEVSAYGDVYCVAFSPDGEYVISASSDGTARVWEATTGKEVTHMTHDGRVWSVAISPDGKYVVSGSDDRTARVWEATTGNEVARVSHDSIVYSVAFSPDGKYVVSGSEDNTARVWEATTGNEIAQMTHGGRVWSIAFSPDGKYVVSGGSDGTARVWEAASGNEIARMTYAGRGFDDSPTVYSVAFSPDGKYVVSGSSDGTARVWEARSGQEIAHVTTFDEEVHIVAFSPDGKYILSVSNDDTARVWAWQAEDLITEACELIPRNFTKAEWQQYIGSELPYQAICDNLPVED